MLDCSGRARPDDGRVRLPPKAAASVEDRRVRQGVRSRLATTGRLSEQLDCIAEAA